MVQPNGEDSIKKARDSCNHIVSPDEEKGK